MATVYVVTRSGEVEYPEDNVVIIGVYSTKKKADNAVKKFVENMDISGTSDLCDECWDYNVLKFTLDEVEAGNW